MNSKRECKFCGDYVRVDLMINQPVGWFCDTKHMMSFVKEAQIKAQDKAKKIIKKEKARQNKAFDKTVKSNDLPRQLALTQPVFNKLRKLQEFKWFADRGLEPTCISCGKKNMDWCNGHFKTVGSQGALRFNPVNSYLQCNRYCNKGLSGNINGNKTTRGYIQGLKDRFGEFTAQEIITYCEVDRVADWDAKALIAVRKKMRAEIRDLEEELFR